MIFIHFQYYLSLYFEIQIERKIGSNSQLKISFYLYHFYMKKEVRRSGT